MHPLFAGASLVRASIGSSLPFEPITLVFQDLHYFVPNPAYSGGGCCGRDSGADVEAAVPQRLELLKGITGEGGGGDWNCVWLPSIAQQPFQQRGCRVWRCTRALIRFSPSQPPLPPQALRSPAC